MTTTLSKPAIPELSGASEPAWDVAYLFPAQGAWTEDDYITRITQRGFELNQGRLEKLPIPTELHQLIAAYVYDELKMFVKSRKLGLVLFAGLRVQTSPGQIREPDIVFLDQRNFSKRGSKFWEGADLAVEIVSEDDPSRDYLIKRAEYAKAGVTEYWIIDPREKLIQVLKLVNGQYVQHGEFKTGAKASSVLLDGFEMLTDEVLTGGIHR